MKQSTKQRIQIVLLFGLFLMWKTNPSSNDHIQKLDQGSVDYSDWQSYFHSASSVKYHNYLFFSTMTKEGKIASFGIFGMVFNT
jgi:hypothetical protein